MLAAVGCSKKAPEPISYEKAKVTQVEPEEFLKLGRTDMYSYVFVKELGTSESHSRKNSNHILFVQRASGCS